ncbi:2-amino-4-hydroxy-6-hydroxymethyldihydropteridine diphosphokinase [Psychromonas sp. CD1]|uniref:2-amino-4-hydroxy-6- hydroxymethyldihydropteridine diphosphokinase n=1 Tax=Psychromonas sp. CD1 TaxID=1979839 RepID=UPI000B9B08A7|nr:2-amino-4-hydroxy-6-hydroxymethyldihydropteridine diphosphokinase [Psychromonas sp. CD1]
MLSYIAIGSNQKHPIQQAKKAIEALKGLPNTQLLKCSSLYCSRPMGPQNQPDYINAVVELDTQLSALHLLDELQKIEQNQGRERKALRWGPRTLDLDIILYADHSINTSRLTIPHYGMKTREFVLYPLFEIAPEIKLPDTTLLSQLITLCDKKELTKISDADHTYNTD